MAARRNAIRHGICGIKAVIFELIRSMKYGRIARTESTGSMQARWLRIVSAIEGNYRMAQRKYVYFTQAD